jgi:uncharacterized protein (DUF2141 family)
MKVSVAIAFSLSLFTASVAVFGTSADSVHVVDSKYKSAFVFKANKSWQGATVEVFAANGERIVRQRLTKRKMVISFLDRKPGTYKVAITKHGHTEEFQYIKNE